MTILVICPPENLCRPLLLTNSQSEVPFKYKMESTYGEELFNCKVTSERNLSPFNYFSLWLKVQSNYLFKPGSDTIRNEKPACHEKQKKLEQTLLMQKTVQSQ